MASAHSTWKGSLKLSLITIPIRVFPATTASSDVSFRQLHRKCHTPIQLKKWCPHCNEEVSSDDIVKGHESSKGHFVLVEDEDIAKVRPESTHVVDISHVVPASSIDPIYVERSYFLAPEGKAAGSPFAVFREALDDKAGVGRLALHGREYLVAIVPREKALMLYTLRTAGEVKDMTAIDELDFANAKAKPEEVKLARQVLNSFNTSKDLSAFTDHYQEALKAMLKAKDADEVVEAEEKPSRKQVVNLMDALRKSLAKVNARPSKKTAPVSARGRKSARVIAHPSSRKTRRAS